MVINSIVSWPKRFLNITTICKLTLVWHTIKSNLVVFKFAQRAENCRIQNHFDMNFQIKLLFHSSTFKNSFLCYSENCLEIAWIWICCLVMERISQARGKLPLNLFFFSQFQSFHDLLCSQMVSTENMLNMSKWEFLMALSALLRFLAHSLRDRKIIFSLFSIFCSLSQCFQ